MSVYLDDGANADWIKRGIRHGRWDGVTNLAQLLDALGVDGRPEAEQREAFARWMGTAAADTMPQGVADALTAAGWLPIEDA